MTKIRKRGIIAALVFIFFCGVFYGTNAVASDISVSINSPSDGETFQLGETIYFSGQAILTITTEDGSSEYNLTGGDLVWMSSLDGRIGTGTFFSTSSLSAGKHRITLIADNEAVASREIDVTASSPVAVPVTSGKYATYNMATGVLYIPFSPLPGISYWLNMRIKSPMPLTFELTGIGENTWDPDTQYATFNLFTNTLHVPDYRDSADYSYWFNLQMSSSSDPLTFSLGGAGLN